MPFIRKILLAAAISVLVGVQSASALTIVRNFTGGTASTTTAGGGSLTAIFNAAADMWEAAIGDTHTVTISYGWSTLGGGTLAQHAFGGGSGTPYRETSGSISFDNVGTSWFVDATPFNNSEYTTLNSSSADFGGGSIETVRMYTGATGAASGRHDLLAVALHEIGHALGLSSGNSAFTSGNGDGDIDVLSGPYAGSAIPTVSGAHLDVNNSLMYPFNSSSTRKLISQVDLLANCTISQFTQCDYQGVSAVPEPSTWLLMAAGLFGLGILRSRKAA
jgi:hypothetical protein